MKTEDEKELSLKLLALVEAQRVARDNGLSFDDWGFFNKSVFTALDYYESKRSD